MNFLLRPGRRGASASRPSRRSGLLDAPWRVVEPLEERCLLAAVPVLVAGAAAGEAPRVTVLDAATGEVRFSFLAYDQSFRGGVRVAVGDVNGDGTHDIITAAGAGGGPHVKVFDGTDGRELWGFFAYHPNFIGGVHVAAGDVNGDGRADIITGAGFGGGPHVKIFNGADGREVGGFFAYHPNFIGGVYVAAGDVNGDGRAEIFTGAGPGGGPHVRVLNGQTGANLGGFFAFDGSYSRGATVAIGNSQIFAGGYPGGTALARSFNASGAVLHEFSNLGQDFRNGMFVAAGTMSLEQDGDDGFEENDVMADAWDLGTLTQAQTYNLHLLDEADWFRFRLANAGTAAGYVRIEFLHANGDVDMGLYNSSGTLVRRSDGISNFEQISLNGLAAGEYFVRVYGYRGVHNANYTLTLDPGASSSGDGGGGGGIVDGANVLYVNFDGATITSNDLYRWAANQWNPAWLPGGAANGVTVSPFFASRSDREQIISGILSRLAADLAPFGITVQRHTGLAVENVGATTLFAGNSTLTHPHVACDVDFGNDNYTDIAFIGEENWGSAANIILALSDVFLHEAGHTYGLYHTQVVQSGVLYPESMGLRYSSSQDQWLQDTSFMDRTFIEYRDSSGNWHGPGGGQSQNSYQTMLGNFGQAAPAFTGNLATVDSSQSGTLIVTLSGAADQVSIVQFDSGLVELTINGQQYTVSGLEHLVIDTGGDAYDQVHVAGNLSIELFVGNDGGASHAKLDPAQASLWNGSVLGTSGGGLGCGCPLCRGALDGAFSSGAEEIANLMPAFESLTSSSSAELKSTAPGETAVVLHQARRVGSSSLPAAAADVAEQDESEWEHAIRTPEEILFALNELEDLLAEAAEPG